MLKLASDKWLGFLSIILLQFKYNEFNWFEMNERVRRNPRAYFVNWADFACFTLLIAWPIAASNCAMKIQSNRFGFRKGIATMLIVIKLVGTS